MPKIKSRVAKVEKRVQAAQNPYEEDVKIVPEEKILTSTVPNIEDWNKQPPRPANVTIAPAPACHTLVHPDGRQYDFRPVPGTSEVTVRRTVHVSTVPVEEARELYARLRKRGFEKW